MFANLGRRVITAAILGPLALAAIVAGGPWLLALVAVAAVLLLLEWRGMTGVPASPVLCGGLAAVLLAALLAAEFGMPAQSGELWPVAAGLLVAGLVLEAVWRRGLPWTLLGLAWVAVPCVALLALRQEAAGMWLLIWVFVAVAGCDTGAYFAGKAIGGPKLAPRVSPNKTWAGLLGGMALAGLASAALALPSGLASPVVLAALGALLAVVSQVGDLAQSAVKRHYDVKDSGSLLPGHGGLFDRVDGLLFAVPATLLISQTTQAQVIS